MDTDSPGPDPASLPISTYRRQRIEAMEGRSLPVADQLELHDRREANTRETQGAYAAYGEHFGGPVTIDKAMSTPGALAQLEADNIRLAAAHREGRRIDSEEDRRRAAARRTIPRLQLRVRGMRALRAPRRTCTGQRRPGARRIARANPPPGGGDPPDGEHEPLGSTTAPLPAGRDRPPADHTTRLGVVA